MLSRLIFAFGLSCAIVSAADAASFDWRYDFSFTASDEDPDPYYGRGLDGTGVRSGSISFFNVPEGQSPRMRLRVADVFGFGGYYETDFGDYTIEEANVLNASLMYSNIMVFCDHVGCAGWSRAWTDGMPLPADLAEKFRIDVGAHWGFPEFSEWRDPAETVSQTLFPVDGFLADSFGPNGYSFETQGDGIVPVLAHDQTTGGDFDYVFGSVDDAFSVSFYGRHRSTGHTDWSLTITPSAEPAVVPLPATALLFGAGLAWLGSLRRTRVAPDAG